jgi:hypothetical protein
MVDEAGVSSSSESRLSVFYGYPAELVAQWCAVSVATARAWKECRRKPSRQALRLFALYANEQVLTPQFRGFRVRKGALVDPAGQALSASQIGGYSMILQFAAELARSSSDGQDRARYYQLLERLQA